jgi:hypothetical protein
MFMGFFDKLRSQTAASKEQARLTAEAEKNRQWEEARRKAVGNRDVWGGSTQTTSSAAGKVPMGQNDDSDPYGRKEQENLNRLAMGFPVDDGSITPPSTKKQDALNPNAMGSARITGSTTEDMQQEGIVDPQMDTYIQTLMAEEAAKEAAKDQDRKPVEKD